jgi:hypothetical protein
LSTEEREELLQACENFITDYNATYAYVEEEIIPPCWLLHPGLAKEIPARMWLHHATHHGTKSTPTMIVDYYNRHLPGFRSRIEKMLGQQPKECQKGQHSATWRSNIDTVINNHKTLDDAAKNTAINALQQRQFGISEHQ